MLLATAPKINFIGCGRVGKTLGYLFNHSGLGVIQDICNLHWASSCAAVEFVGQGRACSSLRDLSSADIYIIATPDDTIETICNTLAEQNILSAETVVLHCSGSLTSAVLQAAQERGCFTLSLHPVKSFADPESSIKSFAGTHCAFEGDEGAYPMLTSLIEGIGGKVFRIPQTHKDLYHVAGVLAANYLVTLSYQANACYQKAGVPADIAKDLVQQLMFDTCNNLQTLSHAAALTGPIARGDKQTIIRHLAVLQAQPELAALYGVLGQNTLPLTNHDADLRAELLKLFTLPTKPNRDVAK